MELREAYAIGVLLVLTAVHLGYAVIERLPDRASTALAQFSGGVALGYVFLYLLPKLGDYTAIYLARGNTSHEFLLYRLYLFAFLGFLIYYLVDFLEARSVVALKTRTLLHTTGFSIYNVLVGFSLARLPRLEEAAYLLAGFVLALHFVGINHQLVHWHGHDYFRYIRWLLALSLLAGGLAGWAIDFSMNFVSGVIAFVGGAIIINAIKTELPAHADVRILPFMAGAVSMIAISYAMRSLERM